MPGQIDVLSVLRMMLPQRSRFPKIRLGSLADGAYVLPDDLDGITDVLSIGVGGEVSFDLALAERGATIHQYDPTVPGPPVAHERFHFHAEAWSHQDGDGCISLGGMMERHGLFRSNDLILKFDTEGAEWQSFRSVTVEQLKHFRIIACELHGLHNLMHTHVWEEVRYLLTLLTHHHTVVHLHANNCCGIHMLDGVPVPAVVELTLLRNDRSDFTPSDEPIPGPLDYPNMSDRPDIVLRAFS